MIQSASTTAPSVPVGENYPVPIREVVAQGDDVDAAINLENEGEVGTLAIERAIR